MPHETSPKGQSGAKSSILDEEAFTIFPGENQVDGYKEDSRILLFA